MFVTGNYLQPGQFVGPGQGIYDSFEADGCKHFEYQPLTDPSRQIRLLEGPEAGFSSWTLTVHDLDQVQDAYHALSYTWGDPMPVKDLAVNDEIIAIPKKLHEVLVNLYGLIYRSRSLYWIDALCINQADAEEKSQQVQLMGEIYASAESVTVYLDQRADKEQSTLPPDDGYFERMWIVQEFLLAKRRHFHGWAYDNKRRVIKEEDLYPRSLDMRKRGLGTLVDEISRQKAVGGKRSPLALAELIRKFGGGKCADPRDQIYSLVSLACDPDGSKLSFPIDYKKSKLEVFVDLVDYVHAWYPPNETDIDGAFVDVVVKIAALMEFNTEETNDAIGMMNKLTRTDGSMETGTDDMIKIAGLMDLNSRQAAVAIRLMNEILQAR